MHIDQVQSIVQQIRQWLDADIEKLLSKNESPLTVLEGVPIESEDIDIVYRLTKQSQYEGTDQEGV